MHGADRIRKPQPKAYVGYHGAHCYAGTKLLCGWPEVHHRHSRQERRHR